MTQPAPSLTLLINESMELQKNGKFSAPTKTVDKSNLALFCEDRNLQAKHLIPTGGDEAAGET